MPATSGPPVLPVGDLDGVTAGHVLAAMADVALVLNDAGVIRGCAIRNPELGEAVGQHDEWPGHAFADTLTIESRPKAQALLEAARATAAPTVARHLNHKPARAGGDVAIEYSAIRTGPDTLLALGRDLRPVAALQQRLVETQRLLDREYASLREAQARGRLLFSRATEPTLVVELPSLRVVEANPAALALTPEGRKPGSLGLAELFDPGDRVPLSRAAIARGGEAAELRLRGENGRRVAVLVEGLVEDGRPLAVVRLAGLPAAGATGEEAPLAATFGTMPDAVLTADAEFRIVWANDAFGRLAELGSDGAVGRPLVDWIGRTGVEFDVLAGALRQHGSVRLFGTTVRGEAGGVAEVEISAARAERARASAWTFVIRDVGRRTEAPAGGAAERAMPRSVEQLTELIGRVALKDLVRDATDVIERLCIEAALELTGNNRAATAEMLGLSRQSLYVKLRRFGLIDAEDESGGEGS